MRTTWKKEKRKCKEKKGQECLTDSDETLNEASMVNWPSSILNPLTLNLITFTALLSSFGNDHKTLVSQWKWRQNNNSNNNQTSVYTWETSIVWKKSPKDIKSLSPSFVLFDPNIVIVLYTSFHLPTTFKIKIVP